MIGSACGKCRSRKTTKTCTSFSKKTKDEFLEVAKNEADTMKSMKIQFTLQVRFYKVQNGEKIEEMDHYFNQMQPVIITEHNKDILAQLLNQFIDEVKGEIEAWSERGSGWVTDRILEAFINVARYDPMRGGSYIPLPPKLKNKRAVLNILNRDNQCLRWAIRAAKRQKPRQAIELLNRRRPRFYGHRFPNAGKTDWQAGEAESKPRDKRVWMGRKSGCPQDKRKRWRDTENQPDVDDARRKHALQPDEKAGSATIRPKQAQ